VAVAVGVRIGLRVPILRQPGERLGRGRVRRDMQIHHDQAVEMSMIAYRRSIDPEAQTIAC
jgi:hypothetical protein